MNTDTPDNPPTDSASRQPVIDWACFLGCSWTWVIAMFLPILLMRDYGWWGWVAFALPNIIGAALLPFILHNAHASRAFVHRHRDVCVRFSELTIAMHLFVLGWLYTRLFGWPVIVIALVGLCVVWLGVQSNSGARAWGKAVMLGSLLMFALALLAGSGEAWSAMRDIAAPRLDTTDLVLFAIAACFGFGLCPYLDLTFHRVRQATAPAVGQQAFAIGFGVMFLMMICFSLAYAGLLRPLMDRDGTPLLPPAWTTVLFIHLTAQAVLTIGAHMRAITDAHGDGALGRLFLFIIPVGLCFAWIAARPDDVGADGLRRGEVIFRLFLLAYGLAFPAYVWLCAIPNPFTRRSAPTFRALGYWIVTVVVATPMAIAGFIGGQTFWCGAALVVVFAARVLLELHGFIFRGRPAAG